MVLDRFLWTDDDVEIAFAEAAADDHFYGAWKGGSSAHGGHPVGKPSSGKGGAKEMQGALDRTTHSHGKPEFSSYGKEDPNTFVDRAMHYHGLETWVQKAGPHIVEVRDENTSEVVHGFYRNHRIAGYTVTARYGVNGVMVHPSLRGQGIGRQMYDRIQEHTSTNLYALIGQTNSFTPDGKQFALAWLRHRAQVEGVTLREAADSNVQDLLQKAYDHVKSIEPTSRGFDVNFAEGADDHFYGAWKGGSAAHGGHPVGGGGTETPRPSWVRSDEEAKTVATALSEAKAHSEEHESSWIVGHSEVVRQKGGRGEVQFNAESQAMLVGGHVIHNHPAGLSLSPEDLMVAVEHDSASMTAVASVGGQHVRYTVLPGPRGWGDAKAIRPAYNRAWIRGVSKRSAAANAVLDRDGIAAFHEFMMRPGSAIEDSHAAIASVAKRFGWTYERENI
jgi:GNAT superfamily N-acetyltransferase